MAYIKSGAFSLKRPADVNQRNAHRVGLVDEQLISHSLYGNYGMSRPLIALWFTVVSLSLLETLK